MDTGVDFDSVLTKSAAVILENQQPNGAYPASPNFDNYHFCWYRDGSFTADSMSRAGYIESAEKFFRWGSNIILARRQHILDGGLLDAYYTYDGQASKAEWDMYQLDGYGTFLWSMQQHANRHHRSVSQFQDAAELTQTYLVKHWQEPCSDWWEERRGLHAASLSCIYGGLQAYGNPEAAAVKAAVDVSHERTDASQLICALFGAIDQTEFVPTLAKIESELVGPDGGVHRHRDDVYYGGGEWPILAGFLGWYYVKLGRIDDARQELDWILVQMQPDGWIPEQTKAHMLHPEHYEEWVQKWGEPANPLLWSQAMLLTLGREIKSATQS